MDDKRESMEKTLEEREELELGVEFEEESIQFVIVTLAEQWCAFYGSAVTSIATVETITPIPGTPDYLLGVMYYQGRVESVLDIKSILGIRDSAITGKSRVAITLSGDRLQIAQIRLNVVKFISKDQTGHNENTGVPHLTDGGNQLLNPFFDHIGEFEKMILLTILTGNFVIMSVNCHRKVCHYLENLTIPVSL